MELINLTILSAVPFMGLFLYVGLIAGLMIGRRIVDRDANRECRHSHVDHLFNSGHEQSVIQFKAICLEIENDALKGRISDLERRLEMAQQDSKFNRLRYESIAGLIKT